MFVLSIVAICLCGFMMLPNVAVFLHGLDENNDGFIFTGIANIVILLLAIVVLAMRM